MLATLIAVVTTGDLSIGVLLFGVFFAGKVSKLGHVSSALSDDGHVRTYAVEGQVFFASAGIFAEVHGCVGAGTENYHRCQRWAFLGYLCGERTGPRGIEGTATRPRG